MRYYRDAVKTVRLAEEVSTRGAVLRPNETSSGKETFAGSGRSGTRSVLSAASVVTELEVRTMVAEHARAEAESQRL